MSATVVPLPRRAYRLPPGTLPETQRQRQPERAPAFSRETAARVHGHLIAEATAPAQDMRQPSKWRGRGRAMGRLLAWIVLLGVSWGFCLAALHLAGVF